MIRDALREDARRALSRNGTKGGRIGIGGMERRFTLIQGGLLRAGLRRKSVAQPGPVDRVTLLRAPEIGPAVLAAWHDLAAGLVDPNPFAHPDYLLSAALNAGRDAEIVFAFAYSCGRNGREILRGIVPLTLPHPVWGGAAIRLWQPPLASGPVEPAIEAGAEAETLRAVLRHLRTTRPRATLRFSRIAAGSVLVPALAADEGITLTLYRRSNVPPFAASSDADRPAGGVAGAVHGAIEGGVTETITERSAIRDAVERFLLVDAEHTPVPLIAEPGAASIVRVATRLFAVRDAVCVELDRRGSVVVGGAIRLGHAPDRVLWRSVNRPTTSPAPDRADLVVDLADPRPGAEVRPKPRLIAP